MHLDAVVDDVGVVDVAVVADGAAVDLDEEHPEDPEMIVSIGSCRWSAGRDRWLEAP